MEILLSCKEWTILRLLKINIVRLFYEKTILIYILPIMYYSASQTLPSLGWGMLVFLFLFFFLMSIRPLYFAEKHLKCENVWHNQRQHHHETSLIYQGKNECVCFILLLFIILLKFPFYLFFSKIVSLMKIGTSIFRYILFWGHLYQLLTVSGQLISVMD